MTFRPFRATHDRWPLTVPVSAAAVEGHKRRNGQVLSQIGRNHLPPKVGPNPQIIIEPVTEAQAQSRGTPIAISAKAAAILPS